MYVDKVTISIKAGDGGNGVVSFRSEKYVKNGGPDGGDGGKGGNIVFIADDKINTLIDFYYKRKYVAQNGNNGEKRNCTGKSGEDLIIKVPAGTIIKDAETGKVIADMFYNGEQKIVLKGGLGGRGNAKFATPTRRSPSFAQLGTKTEMRKVVLELKTIADVGLVGFPNVGKSTILSVISDAKPKIANYHFTTLSPNLGVVKYYHDSFVVADIPGLIEGASNGVGLGLDFLRHIERTRLIVHVVDISGIEGNDAYESFVAINNELKNYSEVLSERPQIVVLNKCDVLENQDKINEFKEKVKDYPVFTLSAIQKEGVKELIDAIYAKLQTIPKAEKLVTEEFEYEEVNEETYEIVRNEDGNLEVIGGLVDRLIRNITLDDTDSFAYFQKMLKEKGIIDKLNEMGVKQGDTIVMGDIEFEFYY